MYYIVSNFGSFDNCYYYYYYLQMFEKISKFFFFFKEQTFLLKENGKKIHYFSDMEISK